MGKTAKIKSDLDDVSSLVEIIQILKDVASNHFYNTAKRKEKFLEFAESFSEFFRMVSLAEAKSPLVHPAGDQVALLAVTSEGGFMAEMNAKVVRTAVMEAEKFKAHKFIMIGSKGADKMRQLTKDEFTLFSDIEEKGLFRTTMEVKEHIIKEVEAGRIDKVFAVYPRSKTINLIKPFTVKLLPSEELITKQLDMKDTIEKVIVESSLDAVIHYLADIWLTCRIYEMLEDCVVAGFAAQSQQLEASLERLKKDKKGLALTFVKAKKSDIDKSLREVFTATMLTGRR
ncbi:MAG: F0F1 ATP synthase subunit gamma [Candidatus Omnitrophota bacterium]|nr:F0F1 ATP synthase subunit gamma [Candidatus Omnitrophota bacterium]